MKLENIYLPAVFGVLLFLGVSNLWDHKLQHEFPYGYLASDTFQQQTRAEGIMDAGNYRLEPFYIVKGFKDVVGYYPPIIHHLGILLHFSSGTPLYDTIYFMVFFSAILAAFIMYIIIRTYNRQIAILSLPLAMLIFSDKPYVGFLWGHWASIIGQLFLICVFWAVRRIELKNSGILIGIFMGALGLAHTSELIYGAGAIFIYGIWLLINKRFDAGFAKKIVVGGVIATAIVIYNLFIFANSFMVINPYAFEVSKDWGGTPIFSLMDFKVLLAFLAIGAVAGVMLVKKIELPFIFGVYMLLIGYTNYIGFGIRAFQPRLLWPIYLSYFFGLGMYTLIKFVPSGARQASVFGVGALLILALSGIFAIPNVPAYSRVSSPGLMDSQHWEAFQWMSRNTPKDAKLYFLYGDVYDQDAILRNSMRFHGQVNSDDFIKSLQNRTVRKGYVTEFPADHHAGIPYIKSFLNIGLHLRENRSLQVMKVDYMDICAFDYYIFDKISRQQVLAQYNLLIADGMLKKGAQTAFENDAVLILKRNNNEDDCIEERSF